MIEGSKEGDDSNQGHAESDNDVAVQVKEQLQMRFSCSVTRIWTQEISTRRWGMVTPGCHLMARLTPVIPAVASQMAVFSPTFSVRTHTQLFNHVASEYVMVIVDRLNHVFAASALQMPSPVPYEHRQSQAGASINFAVGGSGVFNPFGMLSLRGQIDQFESLKYSHEFLQSSVALVGFHGNDYGAFLASGSPLSVSQLFVSSLSKVSIQQVSIAPSAYGWHASSSYNGV